MTVTDRRTASRARDGARRRSGGSVAPGAGRPRPGSTSTRADLIVISPGVPLALPEIAQARAPRRSGTRRGGAGLAAAPARRPARRDHRHERQEHDDRAHRRSLARDRRRPSWAATSGTPLCELAAVRRAGTGGSSCRALLLPAGEHRPAPAHGGGDPERHARSPRSLPRRARVRARQGADLHEPGARATSPIANARDPLALALAASSRGEVFTFGLGPPEPRSIRADEASGRIVLVDGRRGRRALRGPLACPARPPQPRERDGGDPLRPRDGRARTRPSRPGSTPSAGCRTASSSCASETEWSGSTTRRRPTSTRHRWPWQPSPPAVPRSCSSSAAAASARRTLPLRPLFRDRVKALLTIGEDAPAIERELGDRGTHRERRDARCRHRARGGPHRPWRRRAALARLRQLRPVRELRAPRRDLPPARRGARVIRALGSAQARPPSTLAADRLLLGTILALTAIGAVMVYSASAVTAAARFHDSFHFLWRQLVAVALGMGLLALALKVGYRRAERLAYPFLVVTVIALLLVLVPFIGHMAGGARRWINLGLLSFQPAEAAKVALVLYLAHSLAKKREKVRTFSVGFLPHMLVTTVLMGLCLLEKDLGTCVVMALVLFVMLFAAGREGELSSRRGSAVAPHRVEGHRRDAVSTRAHPRLARSVRPSAGRRLSDVGVDGRNRERWLVRARARRGSLEALLPARGAHGLHRRGDRGGGRAHRTGAAHRALRRLRLAGAARRLQRGRRVRLLPGARHHHARRRAGARQPGRRHGAPADEGAHPPFVSYGGSSLHDAARRERAPPQRVGEPGRVPAARPPGGADRATPAAEVAS